ncbi:putative Zinc finger with UFM1-specific peptidase domain protein [Hypsibius exemplaris]|uniref:Zinc finger with UFM1-specific peptidase domain protein n=1 Tax=Hypsibius exemplaris TaxID=2072580 RepID=A0A1W0WYS6_HYPEX|nr:putative Zinc finger with UFM1-specific peptidase domain protein [Hypsibius exemplaris]
MESAGSRSKSPIQQPSTFAAISGVSPSRVALVDIAQSPPPSHRSTETAALTAACIFGCAGTFPDLARHVEQHHPEGPSEASHIPLTKQPKERSAHAGPEERSAHAGPEDRSAHAGPEERLPKRMRTDSRSAKLIGDILAVTRSGEVAGDVMAQLRSVAALISVRTRNVEYECSIDDGKGYVDSYIMRLQGLVGEQPEAFAVLDQVRALLKAMDDGQEEYQRPNNELLDVIKTAAANGKQEPQLLVCSYVGFYGRDLGDAGWGCGYRNAQMLLASLLQWPSTATTLKTELKYPFVPNISAMQLLLQDAWSSGFSRFAAAELDGIVSDSSKWIGTAEIQALFSSLKLECHIRDFTHARIALDAGKQVIARATKVECLRLQQEMFTFAYDYFTRLGTTGDLFVPPLYLQYEGHSRTIIGLDITDVGVEDPQKRMEKVGFLLFDPANTQWDVELKGKEKPTRKYYKEKVFHAMASFQEPMYQILYFTGKVLTDREYRDMLQAGCGFPRAGANDGFEDYSHLLF